MRLKIWKSADGWRWNCKAHNGKIVGESGEAFTRERDVKRSLIAIARSIFRLSGGAVLALIVLTGCTSTRITGPGGYTLKRTTILQKSDIKRIQIGVDNYMEGYRNDGGAAAFETALNMALQYQGMAGKLDTAQAQLKAMQEALDAARTAPAASPAVFPTPPAPMPVPIPAPAGGAVDAGLDVTKLDVIGSHKVDVVGARIISQKIRGVKYDGRHFEYDRDDSPDWSASRTIPQCNGRALIAWMEGERGYVAHFDWMAKTERKRNNENIMIDRAYMGRQPPTGATVWMGIMCAENEAERFAFCKLDGPWQG